MRIDEFGCENKQIVVMIHGLAMSWRMFWPSIGLLARNFHVLAVTVPGHDQADGSEFISVEEIAARLEDELLGRRFRDVFCVYGLSMGGALALRMLADNRVHFQYAVIDGGITPYELPWLVTRFILLKDLVMTLLGRSSRRLLALAFPPGRYAPEMVDEMFRLLRHMPVRGIWRAYDSTDNYTMPTPFPALDTRIAYWYGSEEKRERKLDIQYMARHISDVQFEEIPGVAHAELVCTHPKEFADRFARSAGPEET